MNDEQIKQLKVGFALNAAVSIYAANRDTITVEEAASEAIKLVNALDFNDLISTINAGI